MRSNDSSSMHRFFRRVTSSPPNVLHAVFATKSATVFQSCQVPRCGFLFESLHVLLSWRLQEYELQPVQWQTTVG